MAGQQADIPAAEENIVRREFFSSAVMVGGLAAGYGAFAFMAGQYLYPTEAKTKAWLFVTRLANLQVGGSLTYEGPTGITIVVARHGDDGTAADFIALSDICPHLGCRVQWQPHRNRFFCPCHNGVVNPQGKATEGPPADAGQSLAGYPLEVEDGLLFIKVPVVGLGSSEEV
jgi:cytochrome b6-f complex iron-sulfur subunit